MPTKYILHGGSAQKVNQKNSQFFAEIIKDTKNNLKILLVYFAIDQTNLDINIKKDTFQFNNARQNKEITFEIANKKNFINQVKSCDIAYFSGGVSTQKLLDNLSQYKNIKKLYSNKIIAGESAGANILAKYCYSPASNSILIGLNCVPIILIPHYQPGDENKLSDIPKDVEVLLLSNYQYKIFYI